MSATGQPAQIVWVIQINVGGSATYFSMPIGSRELGVFIFTQPEHAEEFARTWPDMPPKAAITTLEVQDLTAVLEALAQRGVTHVVTDPIVGAATYLDQQTLSISEYIARLQA